VLGWQASGLTSRREAWVLEGRGCGDFYGRWGFSSPSKISGGIWIVRRLGGCF